MFKIHLIIKKCLMLIVIGNTIVLCSNSSIQGHIIDLQSKEPLIGANIMLNGTIFGSASENGGSAE